MLIGLIRDILSACSYICILTTPLAIIFFVTKCKKRKTGTDEELKMYKIKNWDPFEKYLMIFVIISGIIGPLYTPIAIFNAGTTQIGSIIEKREYTENYYVYMRYSEKSEKSYKLKARIRKDTDYDNSGDTPRTFEGYYIEKLYFKNGGHITFLERDQEANSFEELEPYKETSVTALDGKEYLITLTKEKVKDNNANQIINR